VRLTRVHVDAPLAANTAVTLPEGAAGHLTRVLRLGEGDPCILFDGRGGEYPARIASVSKRAVVVETGAHDEVERESPLRVLLLQGLARGERMDLIVQKATELGVAALRPVHTLHSGVKLDERQAERKLEHWRAVAIGACEQCQRNRVPEILPPLPLDAALQAAPQGERFTLSLANEVRATAVTNDADNWITLLVGPEGGLAPAEEQLAAAAGFAPLSLGPRVLRTETAAIAALAVLGALRGDLGRR
jgi:16S rRNA (uracil1498-N3)-methyltransferase